MSNFNELVKSKLISESLIIESDKVRFRPFGNAEWQGYGGAETNAAVPVPMIHDHGDTGRMVVAGHPDDQNAVHMEVNTLGADGDIRGSAVTAHKDTWMHKAKLAKAALELHGDDHEAVHSALAKHGFERVV